MSVFFAYWTPTELAVQSLCQPSGMPLNFVLSLLLLLGRPLGFPEIVSAQDFFDDMVVAEDCSHWATSVSSVFGGRGHGVIIVGSRGRVCVRGVERGWVGSMPCACVCGASP
eukprot:557850-Pelagomonas_calceolata.AAC.1